MSLVGGSSKGWAFGCIFARWPLYWYHHVQYVVFLWCTVLHPASGAMGTCNNETCPRHSLPAPTATGLLGFHRLRLLLPAPSSTAFVACASGRGLPRPRHSSPVPPDAGALVSVTFHRFSSLKDPSFLLKINSISSKLLGGHQIYIVPFKFTCNNCGLMTLLKGVRRNLYFLLSNTIYVAWNKVKKDHYIHKNINTILCMKKINRKYTSHFYL